MAENIAFIGLGVMGYPMAANVRKYMDPEATLYVNDVVRSACDRFVAEFSSYGSVVIAETAKEAATRASIILSIVPKVANVRQVYLDPCSGILAAPEAADRLMLECSTMDVDSAREIGKKITEAGRGIYVDTPVSGGTFGAVARTLAFLVGHENTIQSQAITKRIIATASLMGPVDRISFCGPLGSGLAAKIANNYIACTTILTIAEAFAIGMRYGVDKQVLHRCIRNSTGNSWVLEHVQPVPDVVAGAPSSHGYAPSFKPHMIVKDIQLAVDAGKQTGINATIGMTALETYKRAAADPRYQDLDCTSVWLLINDI